MGELKNVPKLIVECSNLAKFTEQSEPINGIIKFVCMACGSVVNFSIDENGNVTNASKKNVLTPQELESGAVIRVDCLNRNQVEEDCA